MTVRIKHFSVCEGVSAYLNSFDEILFAQYSIYSLGLLPFPLQHYIRA